jgi:uncharacterized protein (DUF433 family)
MDYREIITIEADKRGGQPGLRDLQVTVSDVLGWLAAGMSYDEILGNHPELTAEDIRACQAYAADRERKRAEALVQLRYLRRRLPDGFKFDRDEANGRRKNCVGDRSGRH